jgi:hypothetical protein
VILLIGVKAVGYLAMSVWFGMTPVRRGRARLQRLQCKW